MQGRSKRIKPQTPHGKARAQLDDATLHELVSRRAYELYESRGRVEGHHCEDWLEAEREILAAAEAKVLEPAAFIAMRHAGA